MTYEEIIKEYKKLFILLVEKAGRDTGNTSYLQVEKILNKEDILKCEKKLLEQEPEFIIIVCFYPIFLFCDIYGMEKIENWDHEKGNEKLREFYNTFLKNPTIKFCEKYGIEPIEDIGDSGFKLISLKKDD
jgi:hypothetical protein